MVRLQLWHEERRRGAGLARPWRVQLLLLSAWPHLLGSQSVGPRPMPPELSETRSDACAGRAFALPAFGNEQDTRGRAS